MTQPLELQCQCGQLRGVVKQVTPATSNRVVCYCDDCQAYLHWLRRAELLDSSGGTRILQLPPAHVQLLRGAAAVRCVRLTGKGLYRWYAGCCRWPLGNTVGPGVPMIGLLEAVLDPGLSESDRANILGPATLVWAKYAVGGVPSHAEATASPRTIARAARKLFSWWVRGLATPSPVFDEKRPLAVPEVLTSVERNELARHVAEAAVVGA